MSREKTLESIILKKQDFNEADQIITLFSREEGKLRCLVKAAKLPTSKLQPVLQPLFLSKVTVASSSSSLPKVIRGQAMETFSGILLEEEKLSAWFIASELLIRALPDGEPNPQLFDLAYDYLKFLGEAGLSASATKLSIAQFQIKAMEALGLGIRNNPGSVAHQIWFSLDKGGFFMEDSGADSFQVSKASHELFLVLLKEPFEAVILSSDPNDALFKLVNRFVSYQLEREIKSSKFI